MRINLTPGPEQSALLGLPWSTPLEQWPEKHLLSLPRGISRHVVRFAGVGGKVYAVKELGHHAAAREYDLLRALARRGLPVVEAVGIVADRRASDGSPLDTALITRHLAFSLPYRAWFSRRIDPNLEPKLLDALADLLVRLHLAGFAWGDCSLSNTLFRRDAGALSAYLVDAETGDLHEQLTDGQRLWDLEIARTNLGGELMDLEMAGLLPAHVDPVDTANDVAERYTRLWTELTAPQTIGADEWDRIEQRLRRLNELGYDVERIEVTEVEGRPEVQLSTQVVEAGHHRRRLQRLTGLVMGENQARRVLNDLDTFRAQAVMPCERPEDEPDEQTVARHWMSDMFEPVVTSVPRDLAAKLEPAEFYREVIEHRAFLAEASGGPVSLTEATRSYIDTVLRFQPDELAYLHPEHMGLGDLSEEES